LIDLATVNLEALAASAPLEPVRLPEFERHGVELSIWRLDLLDAVASGNKLFKLAENFQAARAAGCTRLLSFGGAYSNHLHALALHGTAAGFHTIGIVRGEPEAAANPTLQDARDAGMELHFVDRETYRRRFDAVELAGLQRRFGPCHIIPEGASNAAGINGCRALGAALRTVLVQAGHGAPDLVVLPCATGSTLAGVVAGLDDYCETLGIAVLKGAGFLVNAVRAGLAGIHAGHCTRWSIDLDKHGGGYARANPELLAFVAEFARRGGIPVEPVYTGKMMHALYQSIAAGGFARGTRLLALHTGGLQGLRGFAALPAQMTGSTSLRIDK
jgi:1-aminocyclopropane-1-carboxylate deaminase